MCVIYGLFKESIIYLNPGPLEYEAGVLPVMLNGQNWPFDHLKRKWWQYLASQCSHVVVRGKLG